MGKKEENQEPKAININYNFGYYYNLIPVIKASIGRYPTEREFKTWLEKDGIGYSTLRRLKLKEAYPEMFKPENELATEQLQGIVDNHNFFINSMHYYYSDAQILTDDFKKGILPESNVDFKTLQTRYQLFDNMGRLYAHDVTTEDLKKSILADSYQVLNFEQPYLRGVIALIEKAAQQGFEVFGYRLLQYDTYQVVAPEILKVLVEQYLAQGKHEYDPVAELDNDINGRYTFRYTAGSAGLPVMVKQLEDKFGVDEYHYYRIKNKFGETLFDKLSLNKLGKILFCLINGLEQQAIFKAFLSYVEDFQGDSRLPIIYDRFVQSEEIQILKIEDFDKVKNAGSVEDGLAPDFEKEYQLWSKQDLERHGNPITCDDFPSFLDRNRQSADSHAFSIKLKQAILSRIKGSGLIIRYMQRKYITSKDVSNIDLEFEDALTLLPMDKENEIFSGILNVPVVVKFDIFKQGKTEPLLHEVDLDELIPAIEELLDN